MNQAWPRVPEVTPGPLLEEGYVGWIRLSLCLPSSVSQVYIKHLVHARPDGRPWGAGKSVSHYVLYGRNREIAHMWGGQGPQVRGGSLG